MNTRQFTVGDQVLVMPLEDEFEHEFQARVIGYKAHYIQVIDQDDSVWDCEPAQLKHAE
jgi:hypothetical protein